MRKSFPFLCLAAILCAGCAKKVAFSKSPTSVDLAKTSENERGQFAYLAVAGHGAGGTGTVLAASRFVAVRHKMEIVEAGSGLPKSIEAVTSLPVYHHKT